MIESLITSKTRIKLLLKFFLNSQTKSYLRSLANEFGESTNAIRLELNHLEKAGLLSTSAEGNKKLFYANLNHPLANEIKNILKKYVGIDQIIELIAKQIDDLEAAYIGGGLALGHDTENVDLILVGSKSEPGYIDKLVLNTERLINRKIRYKIITNEELVQFYKNEPVLMFWRAEILI